MGADKYILAFDVNAGSANVFRLMAALVTTSRHSSITQNCRPRTMAAATGAERSAPLTGSPRVIQVMIASSTRPIRNRRRRKGIKVL